MSGFVVTGVKPGMGDVGRVLAGGGECTARITYTNAKGKKVSDEVVFERLDNGLYYFRITYTDKLGGILDMRDSAVMRVTFSRRT